MIASRVDLNTLVSNPNSPISADVRRALAGRDPVALWGAHGDGTLRLARAIHDGSSRNRAGFKYLACTGMPDTLVASEIVGHRKGSFPGALRDKESAFAWRAHGGTLVIGDAAGVGPRSRRALAGLVRLGQVIPVGTSCPAGMVDVRVILIAESPPGRLWREEFGAIIEIHVTPRWEEHAQPHAARPHTLNVRGL